MACPIACHPLTLDSTPALCPCASQRYHAGRHAKLPSRLPLQGGPPAIQEVLPKAGLVYSEKGNLGETLCKPKLVPLKSVTLARLEEMEKKAAEVLEQQQQEGMMGQYQ